MLAGLNHITDASGNPLRESEAKGVGITRILQEVVEIEIIR